MTQVYILGDGHVTAIEAAWNLLSADDPAIVEAPVKFGCVGGGLHGSFFELSEGAIRFTADEMASTLVELTGQHTLAKRADTVFGFSMGFDSSDLQASPVWRQFAPWRVAAGAGLQALSDASCALAFSKYSEFVLGFLDSVSALGIEFFMIPAPPTLRPHHGLDAGAEHSVMLEVDRLYRGWMQSELDRRDYSCLPLPQMIRTDASAESAGESSLPTERAQADTRHGALMAQQIADWLKRRHADAAPTPRVVTVTILRGVRASNTSPTSVI